MRKIEILGPAGSKEGIYAALNAGADAVYVGTSRFGARAFAKNPSVEELEEALVYAHLRDKKIYLTVNTLLTDQEIQGQLYEMIAPLYEAGLDACIVQDPGVMSFLHRNFPEMDLHASTQMTLFSGEEANLYKNLGVTRYVPARELSIEEIKQARKQTDLEMEVFVHGALCYCYSGQCLMSEVIGGRSGNRGMCAQPCRLAFEGDKGRKNYLNTKDICTLLYIPELVEAGIDSFKIEGRMKRWEYSAYMSHLYRRYVDLYQEQGIEKFDDLRKDRQSILWQDYRNSQDLYNRGGFSKSYLFETDNRAMMDTTRTGHYGVRVASVIRADSHQAQFLVDETIHPQDVLEFRNEKGEKVYEFTSGSSYEKGETAVTRILPGCGVKKGQSLFRTKNNRLLDKIQKYEENVSSKITLKGTFKAVRGENICFALEGRGVCAACRGDVWQEAQKRPVSEKEVRDKLGAMGATEYDLSELSVDMEEGFIPLGMLKKIRRETLEAWEQKAAVRRVTGEKIPGKTKDIPKQTKTVISVSSLEQLQAAMKQEKEGLAYYHVKLEVLPVADWEKAASLLEGVPYMISFPPILRGQGKEIWEKDWRGHGSVWKENRPEYFVINSQAAWLYAKKEFADLKLITDEMMYETNGEAEEVYRRMGAEAHMVQVYGRIRVMKSAGPLNTRKLITPKRDSFVADIHRTYGYVSIYTKDPVWSEKRDDFVNLDFTFEQGNEVKEVIRRWNL